MSVRLGAKSKFQQPFDPITAVLFKIIQALTFFFILAVIFMNPVAKKGIIDPKAEYIITVQWQDSNPNDIDTWVEEPDGNLVWFQSKEAGLIHLAFAAGNTHQMGQIFSAADKIGLGMVIDQRMILKDLALF